ncbi:MAG: copper oxidase, partial [Methylobacter sp.]
VFNKDYYAKKQAVWGEGDFAPLLGEAGLIAPDYVHIIIFGLAAGLALGLIIFVALAYKRKQKP